jgi:hypothetical protein
MKSIHFAFVAAAAGLLLASCGPTPPATNKTAWKVFQLEPFRLGSAQELSQRFLGRLKQQELDGLYQASDPEDASVFFTQTARTGDLSFSKSLKDYFSDKPSSLPNPEESQQRAVAFLRENKLLPADMAQFKLIHSGGLRMSYTTDNKPGPIIDKLHTLTYGRQIDGIAVQGSGSKIVVQVGNGGEIVGLSRRWREAKPVREVPTNELKTRDIAEKEIRALIAREFTESSNVELTHVALAYYEDGGEFIQPAWQFTANLSVKEFRLQYFGAVPALSKPPEAIGPGQLDPAALKAIRRIDPASMPKPDSKGGE